MLSFCREAVLVAHLFTVHAVAVPNDQNYGAALECRSGSVSAGAGAYHNSYDETSFYAAAGAEIIRLGPAAAGVVLGAATGYDNHHATPVIGGFRASLRIGRYEASAVGFPSVRGVADGMVHFTLGVRL